MKTLWFGITGKDADIQMGMDTFAKATGWTAKVKDADGVEVDNPTSSINHGSQKLWDFVQDTVVGYNATLGAEAGRTQAIAATKAKTDAMTHEASIDAAI